MVRHLKAAAWCILAGLTLSLIACGGGGSDSPPPPPLSLTGTVSDSTQAPVSGATVTAYNSTGALVAQATTNVVGRYAFYGLPASAALTFKVTGPAGTFPAQAGKVSLTAGVVSVLDFYLPSSGPATEGLTDIWQSQAQLDAARRAVVDLSSSTLSATPTAVYAAPFDVSQIGDGYPAYSVSPLAVGVDEIVEFYAAAAFSISGATFDQADLYLPIPQALDVAAEDADLAGTTVLYRFNETTSAWVPEAAIAPILTVDPVNSSPAFSATVTQPGYYRVGQVVAAKPATGTLLYQTSTGTVPAAGVTVYLTGSNYGYQQVVVTDAQGQFSGLVKDDLAATNNFTFTAWGYGVELSETVAEADFASPQILAFAKPAGTPTAAILKLDDPFLPAPSPGIDSIGLIVASGRLSSDIQVIDGTVLTPGRADVSLNINSFDGSLSINATTKGSGILTAPGWTFANMTVAPTSGYDAYDAVLNPFPTPITLYDPDPLAPPISLPLLVVVQTSGGYAKISIDSVTETPALSGNWVITFRSVFSLSNRF
jgi:hypothetical protein